MSQEEAGLPPEAPAAVVRRSEPRDLPSAVSLAPQAS